MSFLNKKDKSASENQGFFDDIKEEMRIRQEEQDASERAIFNEQKRIADERSHERKGILRKVGLVDKLYEKKEAKEDAARLEAFREQEKQLLEERKRERMSKIHRRNLPKYIIIGAVLISVLGTAAGISSHKHQKEMEEKNNAAIEYILEENYAAGYSALDGVDIKDAESLRTYAELMKDLSEYKGKADELAGKLDAFDRFENKKVTDQLFYVSEQIDIVAAVQSLCDAIDNSRISLESADPVNQITELIQQIDENYVGLLVTEKYDLALQTIAHLEAGDDVGKTIEAINAIGDVSLENGNIIDNALSSYEALSKTDKEAVVNYDALAAAVDELEQLRADKAAQDAAEKEAAEKAAEEERIAQEEAEREAEEARQAEAEEEEERQAFYNSTVWVTGDKCYHTDGCRTVDYDSAWMLSRIDAHNAGYVPCSKCWPDFGWHTRWE